MNAAVTIPARLAHLTDTYLADHTGHRVTVLLCALALGLVSDAEADNVAKPALDGFIRETVAPRLDAAETVSDVLILGERYVTAKERVVMQAQLAAHAAA